MTQGQMKGSEQADNCVLQSSLAIAQEIDAQGNAKSAKNVFHYNTQKLLEEYTTLQIYQESVLL